MDFFLGFPENCVLVVSFSIEIVAQFLSRQAMGIKN